MKFIVLIDILSIFCEIALRWLPLHVSDDIVSIGWGNGLVPSGSKLLPGPMLTIWHYKASVSQFSGSVNKNLLTDKIFQFTRFSKNI